MRLKAGGNMLDKTVDAVIFMNIPPLFINFF